MKIKYEQKLVVDGEIEIHVGQSVKCTLTSGEVVSGEIMYMDKWFVSLWNGKEKAFPSYDLIANIELLHK